MRRLIMKKINANSILFLTLILLNVAVANAIDVDINLIEYDAVSGNSQIAISNIGDADLHNVIISIDSSDAIPVVQLLKPGRSVYSEIGVDPGEYDVTVSADEGSESRTLLFSQSKEGLIAEKEEIKKAEEESLKREEELNRIAEENKRASELKLQQEREKAVALGIIKEKSYTKTILIAAGILIIIGIIFWLMSRRSKQ